MGLITFFRQKSIKKLTKTQAQRRPESPFQTDHIFSKKCTKNFGTWVWVWSIFFRKILSKKWPWTQAHHPPECGKNFWRFFSSKFLCFLGFGTCFPKVIFFAKNRKFWRISKFSKNVQKLTKNDPNFTILHTHFPVCSHWFCTKVAHFFVTKFFAEIFAKFFKNFEKNENFENFRTWKSLYLNEKMKDCRKIFWRQIFWKIFFREKFSGKIFCRRNFRAHPFWSVISRNLGVDFPEISGKFRPCVTHKIFTNFEIFRKNVKSCPVFLWGKIFLKIFRKKIIFFGTHFFTKMHTSCFSSKCRF